MDAKTIYENHAKAFKEGNLPYESTVRKNYKTKADVEQALQEGVLIPEIWRECAFHVLKPGQIIGLYSLLAFSGKAVEEKHKASFIAVLNQFNIQ